MTHRTRRAAASLAGTVSAVIVATAVLVAAPAPAYAAPVANDDDAAVFAGGTYTVDPLANDDATFLSSGDLSLCGVRGADPQRVHVEQSGDSLVIEVRDGVQGLTQITYDACQGSRRDSAVVTITVTRLQDLRGVKKRGTRGKVVFTNPNRVAVKVSWGSASSGRPDASRTVPAGRAITISTARKAIYWVGLHQDRGVVIVVGDDIISKLRTRR